MMFDPLSTRSQSNSSAYLSSFWEAVRMPAYFNDAQRQATKDAGKIAGVFFVFIWEGKGSSNGSIKVSALHFFDDAYFSSIFFAHFEFSVPHGIGKKQKPKGRVVDKLFKTI